MEMLETSQIILKNTFRTLFKKIRESPILYFFFTCMIFLSVFMFGFLTYILIKTDFNATLEDIFFSIFFIFILKSAADFYYHYVKSPYVTYPLCTQIDQRKTIFEIFLSILIINLTIWLSFSTLYLASLYLFDINFFYPLEYIFFTIGLVISVFIGSTIAIHFFSPAPYRLAPTIFLFLFYLYSKNLYFMTFTLPLVIIHFIWSINHALPSYLYVNRKERRIDKTQVKIRRILRAFFYRELIVLWRDKLIYSFLISSISTGLFSGYLVVYGAEILIPEQFREIAGDFLPSMVVFIGVYIVVLYTAVFTSLNLFLNEEKTMWILRNLPVKNEAIILGKVSSLSICFLTALPFIPYLSIFIGYDHFIFILWFLVFSFIAGVIISLPIGAKYVGKKSDTLLLYSTGMILLIIIGLVGSLIDLVSQYIDYEIILYIVILIIEIGFLFLSIKLSSRIISLK
jgi:hypothetical protein